MKVIEMIMRVIPPIESPFLEMPRMIFLPNKRLFSLSVYWWQKLSIVDKYLGNGDYGNRQFFENTNIYYNSRVSVFDLQFQPIFIYYGNKCFSYGLLQYGNKP